MCVAFKCVESGCYKCSTIKQYRISIHVYRPINFLAGETPKRSYTFEERKAEKKKERHECDGVSGVSEEFRSCLFSADSLGGDLG